jgi:hypothetical protein
MALFNIASDLKTRQTIWVSTNVAKGMGQANSHTRKWKGWDGDGLPAAELADLHTDWQGWTGPGNRYWCNPEAPRKSFPL